MPRTDDRCVCCFLGMRFDLCKSIPMDFSNDVVCYSVKRHSIEVGHVVQTMEGCISEYVVEAVIDS